MFRLDVKEVTVVVMREMWLVVGIAFRKDQLMEVVVDPWVVLNWAGEDSEILKNREFERRLMGVGGRREWPYGSTEFLILSLDHDLFKTVSAAGLHCPYLSLDYACLR